MLRRSWCVVLMALPACGGGGGGGVVVPVATLAKLAADNVEIGPAAATADVLVRLASAPTLGPCLLEVKIELPPQLTLPTNDRLLGAVPLPMLDGDFVEDRFVVVCGDASNPNAAPLAVGPLFRLRIAPTSPRQPGIWRVHLHDLRGATRDGVAVPVEASPTVVDVIVR